ncbi:Transporter OS=Streptomyces microflavus OX=1919 GN=Smic_46830 PE=4 SV=1 [Streptomyces microflavus]
MLATLLLAAPVIVLTVWLHLTDRQEALWVVIPVGVAYGTFIGWAGLRIAAPRTANRLPEILTAVSKG